MGTTLRELNERLTEIENKLFVPGHFKGAEVECRAILNDSYTKTDKSLQDCTVILCIQAMFEQQKSPKEVDEFVLEQYESFIKTPYQVFAIWFQYKVYRRDLSSACSAGIEYLARNKNALEQWQYDEFIELLVFHCLTELGEYKRALRFLKRNTYLSKSKKTKYIKELQRLIRGEDGDIETAAPSSMHKGKRSLHSKGVDTGGIEESKKGGATSASSGTQSFGNIGKDIFESKKNALSQKEKQGQGRPALTRWERVMILLRKFLKRLKEVAPVAFALIFVGILLLLMRNAVSSVRFDRLKLEAKRFLSLFFALDPLSR
mmetsp:Transcript_22893/g.36860  ORF Transcript_22893/g.36860 Transcript_22893/m.36860 type:complete len:318 (+) Transcript_22893:116-1069(+)